MAQHLVLGPSIPLAAHPTSSFQVFGVGFMMFFLWVDPILHPKMGELPTNGRILSILSTYQRRSHGVSPRFFALRSDQRRPQKLCRRPTASHRRPRISMCSSRLRSGADRFSIRSRLDSHPNRFAGEMGR